MYVYIYMHMYIYMHICVYVFCVYVWMCMCVYVYMCITVHVYMCTCVHGVHGVHVYMCIVHTHAHTFMHTFLAWFCCGKVWRCPSRGSENRFSETEMLEGRCRFVSSHCETLFLSHHFFCATEGSIWWWVFVKAHDTRNHRRVTKDWQSPCLNVCPGSLGTWRKNYQRCDLSSFRWLYVIVIVICLSLFIIYLSLIYL